MLISQKNRTAIQDRFKELVNPVVVQFYESSLNCASCPEIKMLLQELCGLSDLLTLETYNVYADEAQAKQAGVDKTPVIALTDDSRADYGIRFYGAPSGYEFGTLLEDILMVSSGDSGLRPDTKAALAAMDKAVELSVFVTPT